MQSQNKITIVIPTFNRLDLLVKAYESCKSQTHRDFDLIISDNASTDGTREYLRDIEKDGLVTMFLTREKNDGAVLSLQNALEHVKTEWATILCDDDFLEPDFIESIIPITCETKRNLIVVGFRTLSGDNSPSALTIPLSQSLPSSAALVELLSGAIQTAGISGFVIKKEYLLRNPLRNYPKGFLSDTMLVLGAALEGGLHCVDKCLYNRLVWNGSESAFSIENLKLYFSALLLFGKDLYNASKRYSLNSKAIRMVSAPMGFSLFVKIFVFGTISRGYFTARDIRDFWRISSASDKRYRMHVCLLILCVPFLTKGTLRLRKRIYNKLRRSAEAVQQVL